MVFKNPGAALCAAWAPDGERFAVGIAIEIDRMKMVVTPKDGGGSCIKDRPMMMMMIHGDGDDDESDVMTMVMLMGWLI